MFDVMCRRSILDHSGGGRHAGSLCELLLGLMLPMSLHPSAVCLIDIFGNIHRHSVGLGRIQENVLLDAE